ncbi:phospholipase D family protein [Luteimonas sp. RD2P54]|uniref:Phospholipase D family protein n=1 Tax=Luteimonas endophytica TaxID=3042023 RepID=A0ABT6JCA0_9GAMM|nr:phospholipase D family protein [Luteimonas endophytica]MDH5824195.1 phospholipase D family protein [Luteimonas endophytica]
MITRIIVAPQILLAALEDLVDWSEEIWMAFAWASSQEGRADHWRALDLDKVQRAVIGTQFAQTEPWVLSKLNEKPDRLRLIIGSIGTFHPKVILGVRRDEARAIVGSANFTTAAFTKNTEVCVQLDGRRSDEQFQQLRHLIDQQYDRGKVLDKRWLDDYTVAWRAARHRTIIVPQARLELVSMTSLDMPWQTYVAVIEAQERRSLSSGVRLNVRGDYPSYFVELDRAREIFRERKPFAELTRNQRSMLIGIGSQSSGLIGAMGAARYAKQIVYQSPEKIGVALDRLPLNGRVQPALVTNILEHLTSLKGVKLGVATRLLAVKRPDLFVSVNNGSGPQLTTLLGGRVIRTPKDYLDLLAVVWGTEWHRSIRPSNEEEAAIWNRRAALLDAALYEKV